MNLEALIRAMPADLEVVIIGGIAAQRYVTTYVTNDLDLCYHQTDANWQRTITWLTPFTPQLWIGQQVRPLSWSATTPMGEYTLATSAGEVDLLYEVDGIGRYPEVFAHSQPAILFGTTVYLLTLQGLIAAKRATNRPKDRALLQQLEAVSRDSDGQAGTD